MDTQDIRTLKILEEIDQDRSPSQRDLATTLNVSLGLVNSFIKRLAKKGYFKVSTIPANRVRYILTPKGMAEKTRLTYEYIQYSIAFYRNSRNHLLAIFKDLEKTAVRTIVFYGATDYAEIAYLSLQETDISLLAVCDVDATIEKCLHFNVISPAALSQVRFDSIINTKIEKPEEFKQIMGELDAGKYAVVLH